MEQFQRRLALNSLLENSGYKLFKEDLDGFKVFADSEVDILISKGCITSDRKDALNYNLGRKAGLEMVLNLLLSFKEELEIAGSSVKEQEVKE